MQLTLQGSRFFLAASSWPTTGQLDFVPPALQLDVLHVLPDIIIPAVASYACWRMSFALVNSFGAGRTPQLR